MIVLIVDDQYEGKTQALATAARNFQDVEVVHVSSSRDALRYMRETKVHLLIVDLQIPSELGRDIELDGGRQLLEYVGIHDDIKKPLRVVGITSHQDSFNECSDYFRGRGWALLLSPALADIETLLASQLMRCNEDEISFDVAILTALEHTELEAVLELPYKWQPLRFKNDISSYYHGVISLENGDSKTVIACSCPRMGMATSAVLATKLCLKFNPQVLAMTGVAAAVKGEAELGDILVADPSWDWGSGKLTVRDSVPVFLSDPAQIPLDPTLSGKIKTLSVSRDYLDEIYSSFKGKRPPHDPSVKVGPVASGAVVLEDPATVKLIQSQNRKTIGIEMEAYGLMCSAFYMGEKKPLSIVLKSVCDFADPTKGNEWQKYAAYTSAQYLHRLLIKHIF